MASGVIDNDRRDDSSCSRLSTSASDDGSTSAPDGSTSASAGYTSALHLRTDGTPPSLTIASGTISSLTAGLVATLKKKEEREKRRSGHTHTRVYCSGRSRPKARATCPHGMGDQLSCAPSHPFRIASHTPNLVYSLNFSFRDPRPTFLTYTFRACTEIYPVVGLQNSDFHFARCLFIGSGRTSEPCSSSLTTTSTLTNASGGMGGTAPSSLTNDPLPSSECTYSATAAIPGPITAKPCLVISQTREPLSCF